MPEIYVTTQAHFDAAHFLPGYQGPCANMHGHRWVVRASFGPFDSFSLDTVGIAMDFKDLKFSLKAYTEQLDHKVLNELGFSHPTAEKMGLDLWNWLRAEQLPVYEVRVYESPDSYVTVKNPDVY